MNPSAMFLNRHGELRAGWRIALFYLAATTFAFFFIVPLRFFEVRSDYLPPTLAMVATLLGGFVMTRFVNHKPWTAIGLSFHRGTLKETCGGFLLGFVMMSGIVVIFSGLGYYRLSPMDLGIWDAIGIFLGSAFYFAVGAMLEELLFRGYPFQTLIQGMTMLPAIGLMAILFALAHLNNPNTTPLAIVNVGLAAIWLSFAYMKTRGLWLPFGLHFGWNFCQTTIYSFPTSGIDFSDRTMLTASVDGPAWLTGGSFGPEGGLLATTSLVACTWYILKSKWLEAPEGIVTLDSIEDLVASQDDSRSDAS